MSAPYYLTPGICGKHQVSQLNGVSCGFFMDMLYRVKKVHFSDFLAVLGLLSCFGCARSSLLHGLFSLVASSGGYSLVAVHRLLMEVAFLVEHRLKGR